MRWYALFIALLLGVLAYVARDHQRLRDLEANVPIVTLVGPAEVEPGALLSYLVLVRDRKGVAVAGAKVRLGLERNGFDELGFATTGGAGEASVEIHVPHDLAVGEGRLLRAQVETAIGNGRAEQWVVPQVPEGGGVIVTTDLPEYTAGETAHVRAVLEREGTLPAERPATIRVVKGSTTLFRLEAKSSAFGVVTAELPIAEQPLGAPGSYDIDVTMPCPSPRAPSQSCRGSATILARASSGAKVEVAGDEHATTTPTEGGGRAREISLTIYPEGALVPGATQTLYIASSGGDGAVTAQALVSETTPPALLAMTKVSALGVSKLTLLVPKRDFEVVLTDESGHRKSEVLHPLGEPGQPTRRRLAIHAEKDHFPSGSSANVTVYGADPGEHVVLHVSKGNLLAVQSGVANVGGATSFEVALDKELEGLVWLEALGSSAERATGRRLIMADAPTEALHVKATATGDHRIGTKGDIDVEVTDARGAPVRAELSVGAADAELLGRAWPLAAQRPRSGRREFDRRCRDFTDVFGEWASDGSDAAALAGNEGDEDLRGLVLARLGQDRWPRLALADPYRPPPLVDGEREHQREAFRTKGWLAITLGLLSVALVLPFLSFGFEHVARRARRPHEPSPKVERERRRSWLLSAMVVFGAGIVIPPLAGVLADRMMHRPETTAMVWAAAAVTTALAIAPSVSKTGMSRLLAPALLVGQVACIVGLHDGGWGLGAVFEIAPYDRYFVPVALVGIGQLVIVFLGVERLASTNHTNLRDRRACFWTTALCTGLPLTAVVFGYGAYLHVRAANVSWTEMAETSEGATQLIERNVRMHANVKEHGGRRAFPGRSLGDGDVVPRHLPETQFYRPARRVRPADGADVRVAAPLLWQPRVVTDENGHARIPIDYGLTPATFGLTVDAVTRSGSMGHADTTFATQRGFGVEVEAPSPLTEGDEIAWPVTISTEEAEEVTVELEGQGRSTRAKLAAKTRHTALVPFRATTLGKQTVKAVVVGSKHRQMVERAFVVVPRGHETSDEYALHDAVIVFPKGSSSRTLSLSLFASPLARFDELLPHEADELSQSPHTTFEQVSRSLYPSIAALDYLALTKTSSPAIERRARLGANFGVQRLVRYDPHGDGGYAEFADREYPSTMMMAYAAHELEDLARVVGTDHELAQRVRTRLVHERRAGDGSWGEPRLPENLYVAWAAAPHGGSGPLLDWVESKRAEATDALSLAYGANALTAGHRNAQPWTDALKATGMKDKGATHPWSHFAHESIPELDTKAIDDANVEILVDGNRVETVHLEKKDREHAKTVDLSRYTARDDVRVVVPNEEVAVMVRESHVRPFEEASDHELSLNVTYPTARIARGQRCPAKVRLGWKGSQPGKRAIVEIPIPPVLSMTEAELAQHFGGDRLALPTRQVAIENGKIVLYLSDDLSPGQTIEFTLELRAILAGKVLARPATARLEHDLLHQAVSSPSTLTIE